MVADSTKLFFEGDNSLIYLTSDKDTGKPILLKVMRKSHPTSDELSLFLNEYAITKNLPIKGLRKIIGRVTIDGKPALWMEYVEAQTFKQYFIEQTKSLSELLEVMSEVCGILGEIHQHNIIHKDINSNNILITPDKEVKIIDFGISTNISVKNTRLGNPESLEGTLAYISPEQTGRMNRMVDYRSDLYSLGVTFYEALTGMLPFESEDALELVHAHLALTAKPPYQLDKSIPRLLSDLVMKLMSKNAEDRYQSALGIKADIDKIKEALAKQKQPDFKLATEDFSGKFQIPQKLYGREKELDLLLKSYDRTCLGSTELLLIEGYSGVGKTALVHEIHKPITEKRGYFIEGKFDQFQRNVPYFAWIQAFKDFTNQLLTEDAESLERWKTKILQAVGGNGSILIEVIPQMALIIGDQHEVLELGPSEASNRFNLVFQNFVNVISKKEHPLVIFIDDWQWADSASLSLLETLLDNKNQDYLLIITAYRGNEVTPTHPFMMTVEELAKQKLAIQTIQLGNLKTDDLQKLITDSLLVNKADTAELTQLIYAKTQGNAYFVNQILQTLYEKSLLRFDLASRQWKWDIGQIQAMNITDNVVDLMTEKVKQLPEYTQNTLKYAACIGNRFSLSTLALVDDDETTTEDNLEIIKELIEPGLVEGLISPYGKEFKFAHDRVQQAVYSLTSDLESRRTHLKIGRLMVERVPEEEWENYLFEIVNQFNLALSLIEEPAEKVLISQINQEAGQKAKISAAYKPALNYFETAIQLCQESDWQTNYARMLTLYSEAAQVAFLRGDFDKMNQYVQTVIDNARVITDTVPVYDVKMQYHIAQGDQQKAIEVGLYVTHLLEVPLIDVQPQVNDIEGLINLQEMTEPFKVGAMQILDSVIAPAWTLNPQLFQRLCYTMVDLSVRYGDSPSSAVGYAFYGGLLCGQGDIENGYKFGKLAMQVVDKYYAKDIKSKVSNLYISTVMHWREPAKATIKPFLEAVQIGLETGDVEFACYNMVESSHFQFLTGAKLEALSKKYDDNRTLIKQLNQEFHLLYLSPWQQMLANLKGENENPLALQGDFFDEYQTLPLFEADNNVMLAFMSYQAKTILSYLLHQPDQAYQNALQAEKYKEGGIGMLYQPTHNFFYSLSLIAQCIQLTDKDAIANLLEIVNQNQEELQKWASHSPANAKHKFTLVLAELLNLSGEHSEAANYYDLAIDGAKEARIVYEEALANELAGAFYIQIGKPKYAKVYLAEAYSLYQTWGCSIKLKDMASRYELYLDKVMPTAFQAR
ncbi:MAG TPA: serine/threonine protein kinase, partial [Microscillaceae bacterium]|nr:serine/threonine protein kinase [Microscillaceae bacterium]